MIAGVTTFAAGEGVYLLIDLEENTRVKCIPTTKRTTG